MPKERPKERPKFGTSRMFDKSIHGVTDARWHVKTEAKGWHTDGCERHQWHQNGITVARRVDRMPRWDLLQDRCQRLAFDGVPLRDIHQDSRQWLACHGWLTGCHVGTNTKTEANSWQCSMSHLPKQWQSKVLPENNETHMSEHRAKFCKSPTPLHNPVAR